MPLTIQTFGLLTDIMGGPTIELEDAPDTDTLRARLRQKYPRLGQVQFLVAVDRKATTTNMPLGPGAEVALLPPYSGG